MFPVLVIAAAAGTLGGLGGAGALPTSTAIADIPGEYLRLYQAAGQRYRVPWPVLAGVGKVECDHGRGASPACRQPGAENFAGAGGPMQFLADTWSAYGVDGDGDGRADRWNPADAIAGAARYLRASGAPDDVRGALYAYNHSEAYVDEVLSWAARYRKAASTGVPDDIAGATPAELRQAILASKRIELRPEALLDIRADRIDPRLLAALLALSQRFQLAGVGPMQTGHSYYVSGTNRPSNHALGRAVDIGTVDGALVSSANPAALRLAIAAGTLPPRFRPTEIGSPFGGLPVGGAFTNADHQDHVHLGFDG